MALKLSDRRNANILYQENYLKINIFHDLVVVNH